MSYRLVCGKSINGKAMPLLRVSVIMANCGTRQLSSAAVHRIVDFDIINAMRKADMVYSALLCGILDHIKELCVKRVELVKRLNVSCMCIGRVLNGNVSFRCRDVFYVVCYQSRAETVSKCAKQIGCGNVNKGY